MPNAEGLTLREQKKPETAHWNSLKIIERWINYRNKTWAAFSVQHSAY